MLKKYIRDWLGINHDEKISKARISQLKKDLVAVTNHLGITAKVFPNRIFDFQISSNSITADKIKVEDYKVCNERSNYGQNI